jgi:poly(hydroxyalkanoate) depolymerase family esterase
MKPPFSKGMSRATELTRAGRLTEAMSVIRSLVQPEGEAAPGDALEGRFVRLGETDPQPPRQTLAETLRGIAAGGMPRAGVLSPGPETQPEAAQFLSLTHTGPQGARTYRLYVPARRPVGRMPLVVMLHGCTQTPEDFAAGTGMNALAEAQGCLVAWPAQPQGANAQKCWNWFRPEDQGRDRGEPALLAGIVADILRDHPADPDRVYVAGLSAGGAEAAILGASYPELFAAVGVHSGLPAGAASDVPSAFAAMRSGSGPTSRRLTVPVIVFHGMADTTVHPANGAAVLAQHIGPRSGLTPHQAAGVSDGGRRYRRTRHEDARGRSMAEHWQIDGAGHAWAGGQPGGSHTDPKGPDASGEMLRFFLQHART